MSCYLVIGGEDFKVDSFIEKVKLESDYIVRKGDPKFASKPEGKKETDSRVSYIVNEASFDDFPGQVEDAIEYLERCR